MKILVCFLFLASLCAAGDEVVAPGPSSTPIASQGFDVQALTACLQQKKPSNTFQGTYRTFNMSQLSDQSHCKKTPTKPNAAPPTPQYRQVTDLSELPAATGTAADLAHLKSALQKQIANCQASKDLNSTFDIQVGSSVLHLTKQQYCVDTDNKLLQLANAAKSYSDFMTAAEAALNWYTPKQCDTTPGRATGYDHPVIDASSTPPPGQGWVPVLRTPPDYRYVKIAPCTKTDDGWHSCQCIAHCGQGGREQISCPYPERKLIEEMAEDAPGKNGKNAIIGWVKPFDLTDVQLEGSGDLQFTNPDGSHYYVKVSTAANNGQVNYMMGTIEDCLGYPKYLTTPQMDATYADQPDLARQVADLNPGYVFFKTGPGGAVGTTGVALTQNVTVAIDPTVTPLDGAIFYSTTPTAKTGIPQAQMALTDDTGSAIKGPCRIDIYRGIGAQGAASADNTDENSKIYFGVVKSTSN